MNDQRTPPTSRWGDDPFERELRAILRDRAAGPTPVALHQALAGVTRRPATTTTGWRRSVGGLLVAAAAILLLAVGFNPVSSWFQAMIAVPAASPTPRGVVAVVTPSPRTSSAPGLPSPSPVSPPASPAATPAVARAYTWGDATVHLTADDIVLAANGRRIPAPAVLRSEGDPASRNRATLDVSWRENGREQRFLLELQADATDWWISRVGIYDDQENPDMIFLQPPTFRTPIGQAFSGDLSLTSTDGRVPGGIEITNATLDPGSLGFGPTSFSGCTPFREVPQALLDRMDALADPQQVAQLVAKNDICTAYRFMFPTPEGNTGETWCTAPPSGRAHFLSEGPFGELEVLVVDDAMGSLRPQPVEGWGCGDTPAPSGPPPVRGPAFAWSGDGITFTADGLSLSVGAGTDRQFTKLPREVVPTRVHTGPGEVQLRWVWKDEDRVLLQLTVQTDGATWRVTEVAYQDATYSDTFRRWTDVPLTGRLGEAWSGDLVLLPKDAKGDKAGLQATGLMFDPGVTAADLVAPPTPSPVPDRPFAIDNGRVRLTADRLELSHRDDTLYGPDGFGSSDGTPGVVWRDRMHATWMDQERLVQLDLTFRSDGERWWLSDGWISAWGMDWAPLDLPQLTARLGEPFTGDVDVRLPQMIPGSGNGATGEKLHLVIKNLSVEPFRGTMPRTLTGCRPVIDTSTTDWRSDPTEKGQPLARAGLVGLSTADAAAKMRDLGYCYLFDQRFTPDPSLGPSGILETWCDAPPGEVASLRYGKGGEIHLVVLTQVAQGTPKRQQPLLGWGCKEGEPVASAPPMPTPEPVASTAPVAPFTDKAYAWDSGDVRVAADDVTLTVGDRVIHPEPGVRGMSPDDIDGRSQISLDLGGDTQVRLQFTTDGLSWLVHGVEVHGGGLIGGTAISVTELGAPLGESLTGDIVIAGTATTRAGGAPVTLRLAGAEIAAYRPVVARTLRDCQAPGPLARINGQSSAAAVGEVLDGVGVIGAPAHKAADAMQRLGYCYRFSVRAVPTRLPNGATVGGGETWCDTPDGTVTRAVYGDGEIWFEVEPAKPIKSRPQPAAGWGCLSDIPAYASPAP